MRTQQWFTVVVMLAMVVQYLANAERFRARSPCLRARNALGAIANRAQECTK